MSNKDCLQKINGAMALCSSLTRRNDSNKAVLFKLKEKINQLVSRHPKAPKIDNLLGSIDIPLDIPIINESNDRLELLLLE